MAWARARFNARHSSRYLNELKRQRKEAIIDLTNRITATSVNWDELPNIINQAKDLYVYDIYNVSHVLKGLFTFGISTTFRENKFNDRLNIDHTFGKLDLYNLLTDPNYGSDKASLKYKIVSQLTDIDAEDDNMASIQVKIFTNKLATEISALNQLSL